jgi:hypothetical protein
MRKGDLDEIQKMGTDTEQAKDLKIMALYQRFPLSDIYKEKKIFLKELNSKYGNAEDYISLQLDDGKINNKVVEYID